MLLTQTGGGTSKIRKLTDLEERLLALLSDIHLREKILPDTLGTEVRENEVFKFLKIFKFNCFA